MRILWLVLVLLVVIVLVGACGSVNDTPLGGPYGGTAELTPPAPAASADASQD